LLAMFLNSDKEFFLDSSNDSECEEPKNPNTRKIHDLSSNTNENVLSTEQKYSKLFSQEHRKEKLLKLKQQIASRISRRKSETNLLDPSKISSSQPKENSEILDSTSEAEQAGRTPTSSPSKKQITPYRDTKDKMREYDVDSVFDPSKERVRDDDDHEAIKNTKEFVNNPVPKGVTYKTFIVREPGKGFLRHPSFKAYFSKTKRFFLAAKKQPNSKTAYYQISTDMCSVVDKQADSFVGKLRSNFWGTEFVLYNRGQQTQQCAGVKNATFWNENGVIAYQSNVFGMGGPRKFGCFLPSLNPKNIHSITETSTSKGIQEKYRSGNLSDIQVLVNRTPKWNASIGGWMLNFKGRVTRASVKNFQLIDAANYEEVVLQFGRVGDHKFTMDFTYPLTPLQAFAICLSSIDIKLACE